MARCCFLGETIPTGDLFQEDWLRLQRERNGLWPVEVPQEPARGGFTVEPAEGTAGETAKAEPPQEDAEPKRTPPTAADHGRDWRTSSACLAWATNSHVVSAAA